MPDAGLTFSWPAHLTDDGAVKRFNALLGRLERRLETLLRCETHTLIQIAGVKHVPVPQAPGVYLFTQNGEHRYIGRSRNLNARLGQHTRKSSRHNSAPFAFNIAKRNAQLAGFALKGRTREELDVDKKFDEKFFAPAKDEVRAMDFRFVIFDPEEQDVDAFSSIFEVYAAMRLRTDGDFNLFATH